MGWTSRSQKPRTTCGSLKVVVDRDELAAGDLATGYVVFNMEKPVSYADLLLRLHCEERLESQYTNKEGKVDTQTTTHTFADVKVLLKQASPIDSDFEVPFSIQVPANAPATTDIEYASNEWDLDARLSVSCSLSAKLIVREPGFADAKHTVPIRVLHPPTASFNGKPVEESVRKNFSYACWMKKSFGNVRVQLDTDVFTEGSKISAHVWLDSATPDRLQWIKLSLVRCISRNANTVSRRHHDVQEINSTRFSKANLGDATELMLCLQVFGGPTERERDPLKPSASFYHVDIRFLVEVTTKFRGSRPIIVRLPVTIEPPEADVGVGA